LSLFSATHTLLVLLAAGATWPDRPRCEYRVNPLGIDAPQPRLSWILESDQRGQGQTAYRILVANTTEKLQADDGDLWDSGKVSSGQSLHVPYAGKPLEPLQRCLWKVRVWDRDGAESEWSEPASWTTGLLGSWEARWIGADVPRQTMPLFRREFDVSRPVKRALASICGLGHYELRLNGRKVGDHELDPGWTDYRKTCLYAAYDVTANVRPGPNAVGVMLGNGMYSVIGGRYVKFLGTFGPPKVILRLDIEHEDGTWTRIATDDTWRTTPGPITFSCTYGGEDYDARRERSGWDRPGFDDSAWQAAGNVEPPGGQLRAQSAPPIKVMQVFRPVRITEPRPGVYIFDLGQNFSGRPRIAVTGPAGASVKLTPAELLTEQGLADQGASGGPSFFTYTLRGTGVEVWHPRFTYYGFRYVQVEGATLDPAEAFGPRPVVLGLEGQFLHSSVETVGRFDCSNPMFNRIHDLITFAIRSNMQSVLTDCPHREKLGWLEQSHLMGPAVMFNYNVPALYDKIMDDMAEAQLPSGLVPDIAPEYTVFEGGFRDSPEWGSAFVIAPWQVYHQYGDSSLMEDHYDGMKKYAAYLGSRAAEGIVSHGLGDWCDVGPQPYGPSQLTPIPLTATAIYYHDLAILARAAALLGKDRDALELAAQANDVRNAFNRTFFKTDTNQYATGSQASNAMPLALGLVEPDRTGAVIENLVADVRAHGNHQTAGDVGHRFLLLALARAGRSDVIFDMTRRTDSPSYGFQVEHGATTLTEAWDPRRGYSQNHFMLGHVEEWFYRYLAGIDSEPDAAGFDRIVIRPQVVGDLKWVSAAYDSIRGRIACEWRIENGVLKLNVTIPANASATVYVPTGAVADVTEGGVPVEQADGVKAVRVKGGTVLCEIGSGDYRFVAVRR